MVNKLIEAILEIKEKFNDEEHDFVVLMRPDIYFKIREEIGDDERIKTIAGCNVFIIIQSDLPENMNFSIFTQTDYERMEQQEIRNKMVSDILKRWNLEEK